MKQINNLKAKSIYLRLVEVSDAACICNLRSDPNLNKFISTSVNDVEIQANWIKEYKKRENESSEFYFMICRNDTDEAVGTIRMYDFKREPKSFCWGSWILGANKTKYAAVESALMIYKFGFDVLNFDQSHFDVRIDNQKVHDFHLKFGAQKISQDQQDVFYTFQSSTYRSNLPNYAAFLE